MEVYEFTIKGSSFTALLPAYEVSRGITEILNVDDESDIEVSGEYFVQFDQGYPVVELDHCTAFSDTGSLPCNSYVSDYFRDLIQEYILNTWNIEEKALEYEEIQYEIDPDNIYRQEIK